MWIHPYGTFMSETSSHSSGSLWDIYTILLSWQRGVNTCTTRYKYMYSSKTPDRNLWVFWFESCWVARKWRTLIYIWFSRHHVFFDVVLCGKVWEQWSQCAAVGGCVRVICGEPIFLRRLFVVTYKACDLVVWINISLINLLSLTVDLWTIHWLQSCL